MTAINGKSLPGHYGSINDLPAVIKALDQDWLVWTDGNYTEDEISWLHQFHTLCGDKHYINEIDVESAKIHGPTAFRKLNSKQQRDLAVYFSNTFPNYTPTPTQNYQPVKSGPVIQLSSIDDKDRHAGDLIVPLDKTDREEDINDLGVDFSENILPESKQTLYRDAINPLISQLPSEEQLILLRELNALDSLVPDDELADNIMDVLRKYNIDDSNLAFLLSNEYDLRPIASTSTSPYL